ncbi:MAG: O-antigen ligase family protein [Caulobacteraceae bacterium]|nr:O-antigen ligase family protein [Caulobacteraceae bacterium]
MSHPARSRWPEVPLEEVAAALLLCGAMVFGGSSQGNAIPLMVAELLSLPALAVGASRIQSGVRRDALGMAILLAIVALPVVQLVPLPPSWWTRLAGRLSLASALELARAPLSPLGISLAPDLTLHAWLALAPPVAMVLIVPTLGPASRRRLAMLALALIAASVIMGMAQVAGGPSSALRFYADTNIDSGVGFFANRNHQADCLACGLVLAAGLAADQPVADRAARTLARVVAAVLAAIFVVGVLLSGSRAGLVLTALCLAVTPLIVLRSSVAKSRKTELMIVGISTLALLGTVAGVASIPALGRFHSSLAGDLRWETAPSVARAAAVYWPWGSGVGSFIPVYQGFERPELMTYAIFNHAHDDYLEATLESGIAAWAILAAFLVWFGVRLAREWRTNRGGPDVGLRRAATVIVITLLLHSIVDYPLRTVAMMVIFALACGIVAGPAVDGVRD